MKSSSARASRPMSGVLVMRICLATLAVVGLLVAAWLSYQHGLRPTDWGTFLPGAGPTVIVRYSAPWIGLAAALALLAGLLVVSAVNDAVRLTRLRRIGRQ